MKTPDRYRFAPYATLVGYDPCEDTGVGFLGEADAILAGLTEADCEALADRMIAATEAHAIAARKGKALRQAAVGRFNSGLLPD